MTDVLNSTHLDSSPRPIVFFKDFISLFLEKGEGREKHHCVVASRVPPTGDLAGNPGICSDWESNQRPFGSQARTQSTEPHQPGQMYC